MKKFFYTLCLCLIACTLSAQRIAIMDFQAGEGVTQDDATTFQALFSRFYHPHDLTVISQDEVDAAFRTLQMQQSQLNIGNMIRIGKQVNTNYLLIGKVTKENGDFCINIRYFDISTGNYTISHTTRCNSSYSDHMRQFAALFNASSSDNGSSDVTVATPGNPQPTPPSSSSQPIVLYGYLKVFPHDLGTFDARPSSIIENINHVGQYGYKAWRIPTKEELSLLYSNNLIDSEPNAYISRDGSSSGRLRLVCDKQPGEVLREVPNGYVDLGLPSGTLWNKENQSGFYSYTTAVSNYGNQLPSEEQYDELHTQCTWIWYGDRYKVVGPNGQYMYLPAAGWKNSSGEVLSVGSYGYYWTRTLVSSDTSKGRVYTFSSSSIWMGNETKSIRNSVRLVQ